jgi:exosortase/archaeosortase family protein
VLSLSKIEIEVAPQCSGIRSAMYLFMTGLVFSQLFLKSAGRRVLLVLSVLPIAIFKNALRIVTLAIIANYANKDILSSDLHRKGGIPFMIFGIVMLAIVAKLVERKQEAIKAT